MGGQPKISNWNARPLFSPVVTKVFQTLRYFEYMVNKYMFKDKKSSTSYTYQLLQLYLVGKVFHFGPIPYLMYLYIIGNIT